MAILRRKDFKADIDAPQRKIDTQERLLDLALKDKTDVKSTPLSRLHGIKTEVVYYEQIISNRQGNLANNASLNKFDPNTQRFRKISNFVILTEELDSQLDNETFVNVDFEGTAKILPNTIIPNVYDYFVMKVFDSYHLFRIVEITPTIIEKDASYEIRFDLKSQDIEPDKCGLDDKVKETYTFDYNHIGTDYRTIIKSDEHEFITNSREVMYNIVKNYVEVFYNKTLNTIMCESSGLPLNVHEYIYETVTDSPIRMIGSLINEGRSIYDIALVNFINKFDILSSYEYIHIITEHIKPTRMFYNGSIFSAIEHMDVKRLKNTNQMLIYSNTNLYNNTNRLYGRFLLEHVQPTQENGFVIDIFPEGFIDKIKNYNSDIMYNSSPEYTDVNNLLMDMIATFISESDMMRKRTIMVKLLNILIDDYIGYLYADEFENVSEIFYTYPLIVYVLKYMTREISYKEFR